MICYSTDPQVNNKIKSNNKLVNSQDKRTEEQKFSAQVTKQNRRHNHFKLYNRKEQR